jgi:leucyl-tRNA synthetase
VVVTTQPSPPSPAFASGYDHRAVEAKWRRRWAADGSHRAPLQSPERPFYNLMMFPYPSAEGLHVGNVYACTGADVYGRWRRKHGDTVFQPMGFDAFGLHIEDHAVQAGEHPSRLVPRNLAHFRRQLQRLGAMLDWEHQLDTTDPAFYRWTQWLFLRLLEAGLAERREAPVRWCPSCRVVVEDERAAEGHCGRCGAGIQRRLLPQWFLLTTRYAQELLDGLDQLDWPETTKHAQRAAIGRSTGALVRFELRGCALPEAAAFTARPETVFGASFLLVGADHPALDRFAATERRATVAAWRARVAAGAAEARSGRQPAIDLGSVAVHPLSGELLPVWAADGLPGGHPSEVVMATPAHDHRDHAFATAHGLRIVQVITGGDVRARAWTGPGRLTASGDLDGLPSERAGPAVIERLQRAGAGGASVRYRLRDWLVSRQRYWGPPVPAVACPADGVVPVPEPDLPVPLPRVEEFRPLGTGVPPLASAPSWGAVPCPRCGGPARRETAVLDSSLDSAWHYLRYPSSDLHDRPFDRRRTWTWLPVDSYIGGNEHAVGHLLHARFVMRALHDLGLVPTPEPFRRFRAHGVILRDGARMSKSRGNVVDPDRYLERHGADTLRLYLMFMGPYGAGGDFREEAIGGVARFVERVWRVVQQAAWQHPGPEAAPERERRRQRLIAEVDERIAALAYNTAIARLMAFARALDREAAGGCAQRADALTLLGLLAPFAPHLTEELWERIGEPGSVHDAPWPAGDPRPPAATRVTVPVTVGGKRRASLEVPLGTPAAELERRALELPRIVELLAGRTPSRVVAVPDRIVNLVV